MSKRKLFEIILPNDNVNNMNDEKFCIICKNELEDEFIKPGKIGLETLNRASIERGDQLTFADGVDVHVKCRQQYINVWYIANVSNEKHKDADKRQTRSTQPVFDFRTKCFFCGHNVTQKEKKTKAASEVLSKYKEIDNSVLESVKSRGYDEWALTVYGRLELINDLHAEDAIYHHTCYSNFKTNRNIPTKYQQHSEKGTLKRGRPKDDDLDEIYDEICGIMLDMERNDEQITIPNLTRTMEQIAETKGCDAYTPRYLKKRIEEDFRGKVFITNVDGNSDVVTFCSTAEKILQDYQKRKATNDVKIEKMKIIKAAAEIIKNDIKLLNSDMTVYPTVDDIEASTNFASSSFAPASLLQLLQVLISSKNSDLLVTSFAQTLIQNSRPRSIITPITLSLAVILHRQFESRYLIDILHKFGLCVSYDEVLKFEGCAADQLGIDLHDVGVDSSLMFVADNIDHNTDIIDGLNTFHGMGIIACVTNPRKVKLPPIKRTTTTSKDIANTAKIEIKYFYFSRNIDTLNTFNKINCTVALDNTKTLGNLWQYAWLVTPNKPLLNGFMKKTHNGLHPGKTVIHFEPMIDMPSSDYSCIYSTMSFISDLAYKYGRDPILTFDQPLFWKAHEIKAHEQQNGHFTKMVLMLGTFHTCMSFYGSIGYIMSGSGFQSMLEQIYAEHTVPHILSGKAFSRATRAHLISVGVLYSLLLAKVFPDDINIDINVDDEDFAEKFHEALNKNEHLSACAQVMNDILEKKISSDDVSMLHDHIINIQQNIKDFKEVLNVNKTAKLWLTYMDMVRIVCKLTKAQRTGNWLLHLEAISECLPYFAATGHYLYLESAYLYVQSMLVLHVTNPEVYRLFINGYHVVRRSDAFWAGISADLAIEQELMSSVKKTGGLTRGRGMTEFQRAKWLLSTPASTEMKRSVQSLSGISFETSEQHKALRSTRVKRDYGDALKILKFLIERNPFEDSPHLINIENGEVADESVNVYDANAVGKHIVENMVGQSVFGYSFTKKDMAVNMCKKIECDGEQISIDNQLLFQRLLSIAGRDELELESGLHFELNTQPASLFNTKGLMNTADKPSLADALWEMTGKSTPTLPTTNTFNVLDGGDLLVKLPWKCGETIQQICHHYFTYIMGNYGESTEVVFDGYPNEPTTKDTTHLKRTKGKTGRLVKFTWNSKLSMSKDKFLLNKANKHEFLRYLTEYLNSHGIKSVQSAADADVLVARTAIERSCSKEVIVIGTDTDLLILLIHHYSSEDSQSVYFTSSGDKKGSSKKVYDIKHIKKSLPSVIVECILPIHAFLGCDTVSRIHSIGKGVLSIKKILGSRRMQICLQQFNVRDADKGTIAKHGEELLAQFYESGTLLTLNALRYRLFNRKVASATTAIGPEVLPPTSNAVMFHSYRTYHQVQVWKGEVMDPYIWGYEIQKGRLMPITMTEPPAPSNLLKVIRCGCKTGCKSTLCSCRKHGLKCTDACKECRGVSCMNCRKVDFTLFDENA